MKSLKSNEIENEFGYVTGPVLSKDIKWDKTFVLDLKVTAKCPKQLFSIQVWLTLYPCLNLD